MLHYITKFKKLIENGQIFFKIFYLFLPILSLFCRKSENGPVLSVEGVNHIDVFADAAELCEAEQGG